MEPSGDMGVTSSCVLSADSKEEEGNVSELQCPPHPEETLLSSEILCKAPAKVLHLNSVAGVSPDFNFCRSPRVSVDHTLQVCHLGK